jgi:hypothetical protein
MAKMSERMNALKSEADRIKKDREAVKETIEALKKRLNEARAEADELKNQAAANKADIKKEKEDEKERKAKAKKDKAEAPKTKAKRTKKEAPKAKQEEPKESPRAYEDRMARVVASELVNKYKLTNSSTLEEIKAAMRKFNFDNHPDMGGCAIKCKIGNMYLQAMMRAAGKARPDFARAA